MFWDIFFPALDDSGGSAGNLGPEIGGFLSDGASDGGALHFALGVDDDAGVVFEVEDDAVLSAEGLALADDDAGHDLLAESGVTLLDGAHADIADGGGGEAVEAAAVAPCGDDVEVLSTGVVGAVDDGTNGEGKRDLELVATNADVLSTHLLFEVFFFKDFFVL